jgi:hypothetical protein
VAYCTNCGAEISDLAAACPKCGHPRNLVAAPGARRTETTAVVALVLGIFGIIGCPVVLSVPAIIVGNQARQKLRADPTLEGESLARAGVILGWVGVVLGVIGIAIGVLLLALGSRSGFNSY